MPRPCFVKQLSSDEVLQKRIMSILDFKNNCSAACVVLDDSMVTLENGNYEQGKQFKLIRPIGYSGTTATVFEVKDIRTRKRHAMKMVAVNNLNEVKCLSDLNDSFVFPQLFLFRRSLKKFYLHMEYLDKALTWERIGKNRFTEACCKKLVVYVKKYLADGDPDGEWLGVAGR